MAPLVYHKLISVIIVSYFLDGVDTTDDECKFKAVFEVAKLIPCTARACISDSSGNITELPGGEDSDVTWCLSNRESNWDKWNFCLTRSEGIVSSENNPPDTILSGVNITSDGSLSISSNAVKSDLDQDVVTCYRTLNKSLIDNDLCSGKMREKITVIVPHNSSPLIIPHTESLDHSVTAGYSLLFCVLVTTNGILEDSAHWVTYGDTAIVLRNITDQTNCVNCDCKADLFDSFVNSSTAHRVNTFLNAFKSTPCLVEPDRFELYVYIPRASTSNSGDYTFEILDRNSRSFDDIHFSISVDYKPFTPFIHSPLSDSVTVTEYDHVILLCNATSSADVVPVWVGPPHLLSPPSNSTCKYQEDSHEYYAHCMCNSSSEGPLLFTATVHQKPVYDEDGAELVQTVAMVIMCNVTPALAMDPLVCHVSNVSRTVSIKVESPSISSTYSTSFTPVPTITNRHQLTGDTNELVFVFMGVFGVLGTLIIILIVLIIIFRCFLLRKHKRKRRPNIQLNLYNWFPLVDKREFTREHLIFLENKGEGQFGEVWKAIAPGIVPGNQSRNVVAVKKVKDSATFMDEAVLAQELDVMKTINPHPNVVNLLGYCTLPKHKPLYIIMEFAEHGNLKDYLVSMCRTLHAKLSSSSHQESPRHDHSHFPSSSPPHPQHHLSTGGLSRPSTPISSVTERCCDDEVNEFVCKCDECCSLKNSYVNDTNDTAEIGLNPWGKYDQEIGGKPVLWHHLMAENTRKDTNYYYNDIIVQQLRKIDDDDDSQILAANTDLQFPNNHHQRRSVGVTDQCADFSPDEHLGECLSDDAVPCSDQTAIHNDTPQLMENRLILDWAIQIARGMNHLENMKCLHRDLAARNILIADGFLLKVSDFGLARNLSDSDYYRKQTYGKLPARWMAIESLDSRRLHTHKSDVWSYGVLLWEIHSYGKRPYGSSNVAATCESILKYLKNGNRLQRPEQCSDEMYDLMIRCWNEDASLRPSFSEIVRILDKLLSIEHGYLPLSEQQQQLAATGYCDGSIEDIAISELHPQSLVSQSRSHSHSPFPHSPILVLGGPDSFDLRSHSHSPFCMPHTPIPIFCQPNNAGHSKSCSHSPCFMSHSHIENVTNTREDTKSRSLSPFPTLALLTSSPGHSPTKRGSTTLSLPRSSPNHVSPAVAPSFASHTSREGDKSTSTGYGTMNDDDDVIIDQSNTTTTTGLAEKLNLKTHSKKPLTRT